MSNANADLPLFMFPGLNGETWIFDRLRVEIPQLQPIPWIPPKHGEPLAAYAARIAEPLRAAGPCYVGGVSFGGVVALEAAKLLDAKACFVISSMIKPTELPPHWRRLRYLGQKNLQRGLAGLGAFARILPRFLGTSWSAQLRRLNPEQRVWREWALPSIVSWRNLPGETPLPRVLRLHGKFDTTFAAPPIDAEVVPTAGHLLIVTHTECAIDFIRRGMATISHDKLQATWPTDDTDSTDDYKRNPS